MGVCVCVSVLRSAWAETARRRRGGVASTVEQGRWTEGGGEGGQNTIKEIIKRREDISAQHTLGRLPRWGIIATVGN